MGNASAAFKLKLSRVKGSPRVRMAARLYASGAAKTKKEASTLAGLHPNYLTMLTGAGNVAVATVMDRVEERIESEAVTASALIEKLSYEAVEVLGRMMRVGMKEEIRLRAAIDLADRGQETSKVQKHQVTAFTITGQDAKDLARALVQSAEIKAKFAAESNGDVIRVADPMKVYAALPPIPQLAVDD